MDFRGRSHGTSQLRGCVGVSVWCDTGQIVGGGPQEICDVFNVT